MESQLSLFEQIKPLRTTPTPAESNHRFCKDLELDLIHLGFVQSSSTNPKIHSFIKRSPYVDMYGTNRHSSFLLNTKKHGLVRIEAHRQETSGSVDQKFPFFFNSLMNAPEKNIVIVFDGSGYKREAYDWLLSETNAVNCKNFRVFPHKNELLAWLAN